MKTLIFDIETVGEDFRAMDATTQEVLTKWIREDAENDTEYAEELERLKGRLGFSPFTAQIVAIGTLDADSGKGGVYFQSPEKTVEPFEENGVTFEPMDEPAMLRKFWEVAQYAQVFVSFNGRGFDVPFLVIRSAVHRIRPTKDLMSNRYLGSQRDGAKHIDLQDQLTFYGVVRKRPSLHLASRAFGIGSPKAEGVTGDDVAPLFQRGEYMTIAQYNLRDLRATKGLYDVWRQYVQA